MGASSSGASGSARDSQQAHNSLGASGRRSISTGRASLAPGGGMGRESLYLGGGSSALGGPSSSGSNALHGPGAAFSALSSTLGSYHHGHGHQHHHHHQAGDTRPVKTRSFVESAHLLLLRVFGENNMAGGQNMKKAVREPTQLAFVDMFQTIWRRFVDAEQTFESSAGTGIDSAASSGAGSSTGGGATAAVLGTGGGIAGMGTNMSKAVDEIMLLLREVAYPAMEDLTKSRLSAAGSASNWHYCLAMLCWLVQLGEKLNDDAFPIGPRHRVPEPLLSLEDNATTQLDNDGTGRIRQLQQQQQQMEALHASNMDYFYPFLYKTYDKFWHNQDEFPEEREELERIFDARDQQVQREVEELHRRAKLLGAELHELQANPSPLEEARAADELFVSDIRKFQDYYTHHIKRKMERTEAHIARFAATEGEVGQKLGQLQAERDQLQREVEAQPMTSDEYDRLAAHYKTLQEQLRACDAKRAAAESERGQAELEAYRKQTAMEEEFKRFNALGAAVGLFPFALPRESQARARDGMHAADELTFERGELYPDVALKAHVRPRIAQLVRDEAARRMAVAEQKLALHQKYDFLLDEVKAAREQLAEQQKRHEMTRLDIDKVNQVSKDEGEMADSMEREHQRHIHEVQSAGHSALSEQVAREARLRWQ